MEFKFTQHKGTDVYLVKMAEEDFEALEDNQVLVQVCIGRTPACFKTANTSKVHNKSQLGMTH